VRNGRAATNEYRAWGESNDDVRNKTTPRSSVFASLRRDKPRRHSTSDSGVWAVVISWISGRTATRELDHEPFLRGNTAPVLRFVEEKVTHSSKIIPTQLAVLLPFGLALQIH